MSCHMKIVAIVQARMGSTRLPGKVLKKVLDKPLLNYQLERVGRANFIEQIIVATTKRIDDDSIESFCKVNEIQFYRGPEDDVLRRYVEAAEQFQADVIVRLTADCPLIDPSIIDLIIQQFIEFNSNNPLLFVSNTLERTYPRGIDVEVFSYKALKEADEKARSASEREHVTKFIVNHPQLYKLVNVRHHEDLSHHRWTVDTPEDFMFVKKVLETLYPQKHHFSMEDVIELLNNHPTWQKINAHIQQKDE